MKNNAGAISFGPEVIIELIIEIIILFIQGIAIWKAARQDQRNWFIALLITAVIPIPLFAIIDFLYLFKFSKKRLTVDEIRGWFNRKKK